MKAEQEIAADAGGSRQTRPLWLASLDRGETIDPHHGRPLIFHGYTVLATEADGTIGGTLGLYDYDTRLLSKYRLFVDDQLPQCDTSAIVESDYWAGQLTVARPGPDA